MLTSRGWWFLIVVLVLLLLGVLGSHAALAFLGIALLCWFLGEWLLFSLRARLTARGVTALRLITDGHAPVSALWAGRTFSVRVVVRLQGWLGLPCVAVAERVPLAVELTDGSSHTEGALRISQPLEMNYQVRCAAVGQVRFEGVRLQLADFQGFFYFSTFVPCVDVLRVLPPLVDAGGQPATNKRHNLLPPPGIHRLRRPGSGSELLDLRDYLPGDPPKTIAWKVSARRDRLITKEFDSEVPVRCTLFVDASSSVRVGPAGQTALGQLVTIAAAVAQANAAQRDLTGVCLCDEHAVERLVRPARGPRHLAQLLRVLVDAVALPPATERASVDDLMQLAYPLAQEVYPHLMRPELNRVPFWLPWLWPVPAESGRPPSLLFQFYRPVFLLLSFFWLLGSVIGYYVLIDVLQAKLPPSYFPSPLLLDLGALGGVLLAISFLRRLHRLLPLALSFSQRRKARWRKRLAALLASHYDLGPGGIGLLLEDDEQFALLLQRFLADHQVPFSLPLYDAHGRYLFAAPGKVEVLARALLQSVSRGHDNELFVIMADLVELADHLEPLLRAARVALARHHQLVVVCPWPHGLPLPGKEPPRPGPTTRSGGLSIHLQRATLLRFQTASQRVRRAFARLGVSVIWAAGDEPIPLILERMDRLRGLGRRR